MSDFSSPIEIDLGQIAGISAYDIAVKKGFKGTEDEWLASLKGEKGDAGKDGEDGRDGNSLTEEEISEALNKYGKIDYVVKQGSKNLVSSGAVFTFVRSKESKSSSREVTDTNATVVSSDGDFIDVVLYNTDVVPTIRFVSLRGTNGNGFVPLSSGDKIEIAIHSSATLDTRYAAYNLDLSNFENRYRINGKLKDKTYAGGFFITAVYIGGSWNIDVKETDEIGTNKAILIYDSSDQYGAAKDVVETCNVDDYGYGEKQLARGYYEGTNGMPDYAGGEKVLGWLYPKAQKCVLKGFTDDRADLRTNNVKYERLGNVRIYNKETKIIYPLYDVFEAQITDKPTVTCVQAWEQPQEEVPKVTIADSKIKFESVFKELFPNDTLPTEKNDNVYIQFNVSVQTDSNFEGALPYIEESLELWIGSEIHKFKAKISDNKLSYDPIWIGLTLTPATINELNLIVKYSVAQKDTPIRLSSGPITSLTIDKIRVGYSKWNHSMEIKA